MTAQMAIWAHLALLVRSALRVRLDRKALKGRPAVEVVPRDRG
jgi:hypothetical protein